MYVFNATLLKSMFNGLFASSSTEDVEDDEDDFFVFVGLFAFAAAFCASIAAVASSPALHPW